MNTFTKAWRGHPKGIIASAAAIVALVLLIVTVTYSAARAAEADAHTASVRAAQQAAVADSLRHDQGGYRNGLGARLTAEQQALAEQAAAEAAAAQAAAEQAAADQAAADQAAQQSGGGAPAGSGATGGQASGGQTTDPAPADGTPTDDALTQCPPPNVAHVDADGNLLYCEPSWQCAQRDDDGNCTAWML